MSLVSSSPRVNRKSTRFFEDLKDTFRSTHTDEEMIREYNLKRPNAGPGTLFQTLQDNRIRAQKGVTDSSQMANRLKPPQGRLYAVDCAKHPGGIRVRDMIFGVQMAHLSATDDSEGRLASSGANTLETLQSIVKRPFNLKISEDSQSLRPPGQQLRERMNILRQSVQLKVQSMRANAETIRANAQRRMSVLRHNMENPTLNQSNHNSNHHPMTASSIIWNSFAFRKRMENSSSATNTPDPLAASRNEQENMGEEVLFQGMDRFKRNSSHSEASSLSSAESIPIEKKQSTTRSVSLKERPPTTETRGHDDPSSLIPSNLPLDDDSAEASSKASMAHPVPLTQPIKRIQTPTAPLLTTLHELDQSFEEEGDEEEEEKAEVSCGSFSTNSSQDNDSHDSNQSRDSPPPDLVPPPESQQQKPQPQPQPLFGDDQTPEVDFRKPLSFLLKEHFNLNLDCWIDESGVRCMRPVDTQGFIASNDDTIVLSFRFSTTLLDWLTNVSMSSSVWQPDIDEDMGRAAFCSCVQGCFPLHWSKKPRVHTGYYNNFIYTIPFVRKHIVEKLCAPGATPKKVYICGCSLGAAMATVAFCWLVLELPLERPDFDHKIIAVTAGSPRVFNSTMRNTMLDRMSILRPMDRAVMCRLVYNQDIVPHFPFRGGWGGFVHLDKLVYITEHGEHVIINPRLKREDFKKWYNYGEVREVIKSFRKQRGDAKKKESEKDRKIREKTEEQMTAFEKELEMTPGPIKDHMPYWYLTCLERLKAKLDGEEEKSWHQLEGEYDFWET